MEGRDLWTVVRVCRNPFSMRTTMGDLVDDQERILRTDRYKVKAF